MSCLLSGGYVIPTCKITSGIKKVYIADFDKTKTSVYSVSSNAISASAATETYYEFEQRTGIASYTEAANQSTENMTSYVTGTLQIELDSPDAATKNQIAILLKGIWRIVIVDENGVKHQIGYDSPVHVTAMSGGLGKTWADGQKYSLTFTSMEKTPIYTISSTTNYTGL